MYFTANDNGLEELILDNTDQFIAAYDTDLRLIYFNKAFAKAVLLYENITVSKGLKLISLLPFRQKIYWFRLFYNILKGHTLVQELDYVGSAGQLIYLEAYIRPIVREGQIVGYSQFLRDISLRRSIVDRLHQSELFFRNLYENAPLGILLINKHLVIRKANTYIQHLLGYDPQQYTHQTLITTIHPVFIPSAERLAETLNEQPVVGLTYQEKRLCADGSYRWLEITSQSVFDENGNFAYRLDFLVDIEEKKRYEEDLIDLANARDKINQFLLIANQEITHQKEEITTQAEQLRQMNDEMRRINLNLEQQIKERTKKLQQAYQDLSLINNELDTFIYRASHDLRRPLTSLMGLADVGQMIAPDPDIGELFARVRSTAESMDTMMQKLRMMGDIYSDNLSICTISLDEIRQLVESTIQKLQEDHLSSIQLIINILEQEELPAKPFVAQLTLLKIMLENLLENSFIFGRNENPEIKLTLILNNANLYITLRDNGVGIDPEFYERIFEMFFVGSEYSRGNGLGLYVTKKALDKLSGTIKVNSVKNEFTEFQIWIPSQV